MKNTNETPSEIKAVKICPFCGGKPEVRATVKNANELWARCKNTECDASERNFVSLKAWNTRAAAQSEPPAELSFSAPVPVVSESVDLKAEVERLKNELAAFEAVSPVQILSDYAELLETVRNGQANAVTAVMHSELIAGYREALKVVGGKLERFQAEIEQLKDEIERLKSQAKVAVETERRRLLAIFSEGLKDKNSGFADVKIKTPEDAVALATLQERFEWTKHGIERCMFQIQQDCIEEMNAVEKDSTIG